MGNVIKTIAELMAISAKTAPKARGQDYVFLKVVYGDDVAKFADSMIEYGEKTGKRNYDRDGENVRKSDAVLLLYLSEAKPCGLNCGACGYDRCNDLPLEEGPEFDGGICAWRLVDLGIAAGSAVKTASILNVDNRIMYRIGVVAKQAGFVKCEFCLGIPISAYGKNIYFDRK